MAEQWKRKLDKQVKLQCLESEREAWKAKAASHDLGFGDWCREVLNAAAGLPTKKEKYAAVHSKKAVTK